MTLAAVAPASREVRVLACTRLSNDPGGRRITHAAQRRAITELVERQGWPPIAADDWFSDTDKSASKVGVSRPEWERLLATVEGIDPRAVQPIVVGYAQDRMMRQVGDLPTVANLIERKRGELWTTTQGQVSVRKGGRVGFYVSGVVAADEAERISARTTAGMAEAAMSGRRHGIVAYGWQRVHETVDGKPIPVDVIDTAAQAVVVELARRVLAGESLRGIARDLNERGVPAPGAGAVRRRDEQTREPIAWAAGEWNPAKVRQILLRKSNIGIRVHSTGSGVDAQVTEYPAVWEPLLDEATYRQVVAVLGSDERRTSRSNVARHLLSGIAVCGVCQQVITAQKHTDGKRTQYRCRDSHVSKMEGRTDRFVQETVLALLDDPQVRGSLRRDDSDATTRAVEEAAAARVKIAELEDAYAESAITMDSFKRLSARVRETLRASEAVLSRRRDSAVYDDLVNAHDLAAAWDETPLDRRRAIIAALVTITLHPAVKRGRGSFDPSTIDVRLRAH